jgi:hypothetical protein
VSATYRYTLNGTPLSVTTEPVDITIYPMPQLLIDYYVPRDVKANRAVKLGVVIRNIGDGPANGLLLQSGQPVITDNKSGLLISFGLIGGSVHGGAVPVSGLTLDFGTLTPHSQTYGYWALVTDIDGQFTAFTADYSERDFKGAKLSPLIIAVHTNIVVQGDVVPAGGQSLQVVASSPNVDPSTLLDLETGISSPVSTVYVQDATLATSTNRSTTYLFADKRRIHARGGPGPVPEHRATVGACRVQRRQFGGSESRQWAGVAGAERERSAGIRGGPAARQQLRDVHAGVRHGRDGADEYANTNQLHHSNADEYRHVDVDRHSYGDAQG